MPPSTRARLAIAADVLILLLVLLALLVLATGGGGVRTAAFGRLSLTDPWRPLFVAAIVAALRVALSRSVPAFGAGWRALRHWAFPADPDPAARSCPLPSAREQVIAFAALAGVVAVALYPQLRSLYLVPDLGDPLFSMWRMAWVVDHLFTDPGHLFDANIFYPLKGTLTYSDSIILPALTIAPLRWLGVPLAIAYNLLFLSGFVLSAWATYLLARALGAGPPGAFVAATLFGLAPFRMQHYSHLELQLAHWMPLALLGAHRLLATGRARYLVLLALALAAQWYSSMYYALFLSVYVAVFCGLLALWWRTWRRLPLAAAGVLLGAALAWPLAHVYGTAAETRGVRFTHDILLGSARPSDYLVAHQRSAIYPHVPSRVRSAECELFPMVTPLVLGLAGAAPPFNAARLAIAGAGLVAFDGSLGLRGFWYQAAHRYLKPFQSVRVPARFAMLVSLSLALLAATGVERVTKRLRSSGARTVAAALVVAAFLVEARPVLHLEPVWKEPPPIYASVGAASGAVLFEYPVHSDFAFNLRYMYFSTWHWTPMVNGYSGFEPGSWEQLWEATRNFPNGDSVAYLQRSGVTHVAVHCALWEDASCPATLRAIDKDGRLRPLVSAQWQRYPARLYELQR